MSLLVGSEDTIRVPLCVEVRDGDKVTQVKFMGVYTRTTKKVREERLKRIEALQKEIKDIDANLSSDEKGGELTGEKVALLNKLEAIQFDGLVGWEGLKGKGGEEIPYSKEALEDMLNYDPYRKALLEGAKKSNGVVDQGN